MHVDKDASWAENEKIAQFAQQRILFCSYVQNVIGLMDPNWGSECVSWMCKPVESLLRSTSIRVFRSFESSAEKNVDKQFSYLDIPTLPNPEIST